MKLLNKIKNRSAIVGVLGMGYVGLPLAVLLAKKGFQVLGIDRDEKKIARLQQGGIEDQKLKADLFQVLGKNLQLTRSDPGIFGKVEVFCVTLPTPLKNDFTPDLSILLAGLGEVASYARGKLIIVESSTYPGTLEEKILPLFIDAGKAGRDFFLAYSPERLDPGNKDYDLKNTPRLVAGITPRCRELSLALYEHLGVDLHPVSVPGVAEMAKLLENSFRAINISFVNEIARFCHYEGLDVWEVLQAASSKPFGFMPFYPGPGAGGHCIPVDPLYLLYRARNRGFPLRFIQLAWEINSEQPRFILQRIWEELNLRGKCLFSARILLLGLAYKENVADHRETPALPLWELLEEKGARVSYSDPYIPEIERQGKKEKSRELTPEFLEGFDCVILHTPHQNFDFQMICRHAPLLFDCRGFLPGARERICRL